MTIRELDSRFTIRTHRPGDLGYVVFRHGAVYNKEYNYGPGFEAIVARIAADFLDNFDETRDRCWIAEQEGTFMGCVMLVKDLSDPDTAKLRVLMVESAARGLGVGRALVRGCVAFAREAGYHRIVLWTSSNLVAARKLYEAEGFRIVKTSDDLPIFMPGSIGEHWELDLEAHDAENHGRDSCRDEETTRTTRLGKGAPSLARN